MLYDGRTKADAAILCQLRTNCTRLRSYLATIRIEDSPTCTCVQKKRETVAHFLFDCPRWESQRGPLREFDRFGDVSFFVGGYSHVKNVRGERVDGPKDQWTPNFAAVDAVIDFAKATGRLALHILPRDGTQGSTQAA